MLTTTGDGAGMTAWGGTLQADEKILIVGTSNSDFVIARYDTEGSLDPTFGTAGIATVDAGDLDTAFDVAVLADNRIVVFGAAGFGEFALARLNEDGSLDSTFGTNGIVTTDFGGGDEAFAGRIQTDGKIVAAGHTMNPGASVDSFAIARYETDGSLDASFGTNGLVLLDFGGPDIAFALAIQADGKILVAGKGGPSQGDFAIARLNTDGSTDLTFGNDGKVLTDFDNNDGAEGLAVQIDGKILAVGTGSNELALARYNPDGSLDTSFDGDGKVTTPLLAENIENGHAITIQANGKIVAGGVARGGGDESFGIARYLDDGSLDVDFGDNGIVITDFGDPVDVGVVCPSGRKDCSTDILRDIVIQADGKIVAIGSGGPTVPPSQFAAARYVGDPPAIAVNIVATPVGSGQPAVGVLTEDGFDATQVDPQSVRLWSGQAGAAAVQGAIEDLDRDGDPDRTLHFGAGAAGLRCENCELTLTGETYSGEAVRGRTIIVN